MSIWNDLADIEFKLHFVDADGVKTRVLESGTGEPLLLLHGTGGTSRLTQEISKDWLSISA